MARFARITSLFSSLILSLVVLAGQCFAQNQCRVKPGNNRILIPLQNAPNSFEPACQPARIRVADRKPVILHITGLSPLDICAVSSKPPAVTTVTNPIEALITKVGGFNSFSIAIHNAYLYKPPDRYTEDISKLRALFSTRAALKRMPNEADKDWEARKQKAESDVASDEDALKKFEGLSNQIKAAGEKVFDKQTKWQDNYNSDIKVLGQYLAGDYRGNKFAAFDPQRDSKPGSSSPLKDVSAHTPFPTNMAPGDDNYPPNEVDLARLQGLVDGMSDTEKRLISSCTVNGTVCTDDGVLALEELFDWAKAELAVATDNLKILQTQQAAVVTNYTALKKAQDDYAFRLNVLHVISLGTKEHKEDDVLVQDISLGPDYGATDAGVLTCFSDAAPTQPTTDSINYSILYQDVPALTASAGILTTFLAKQVVGTAPKLNSDGVTSSTYFAVTDSARAQVFPMAFVNYKIPFPFKEKLTTWPGQPETELVITNSVSTGIGVNSNTGTNQPEFFLGDAIGFNRIYVHLGVHFGRTESLGGGFKLNTPAPTGFSGSAPINWSYHPAFSIGLSVRIAPF
ncbi:MAG TPA: hypothetical protein VN948_05885 [Terriglobales bacterium]|nr:hypothetical protein [Terriglobales bacterium]